ncbi:TIGR02281 family clan AA aspartic protease [soil metagenome]
MIRFDFQSAAVMVMATASSLSVAFWLTHADDRNREARAEALMPSPAAASAPMTSKSGAAQVMRAADGHYWAEARIDGHAVRVLVDTGASVVALTRDDALRLGLKLSAADFTSTVQTASGPARAAPVTLRSVAVAGAEVSEVQALVVEQGLAQSLLGMSYLGRLSAFEATPAALTLRP